MARSRASRRRLVALLLGAALMAGLYLHKEITRGYQAALTLAELGGLPIPAWLDTRAEVARDTLGFTVGGTFVRADRYRPAGRPRAALVLVPGAAGTGKDDPRLVQFATALAHARLLVVVPDVPGLRQWQLRPDEAAPLAATLRYLRERPDLNPGGRLGLGAFSVAIGPAVLAATEVPVDFILDVGGYYDLPRTLDYLTTGHYAADGATVQRTPNEYGKWVAARSYASQLPSAHDRELLGAIARRKIEIPSAQVEDLARSLGPHGRAVFAYITNTDPQRAAQLRSELPERVLQDIRGLDLARRDLAALGARWLIVHGRDDTIIPYQESRALAAALAARQGPRWGRLFILRGLAHVDRKPGTLDQWTLWRALYALLAAADGQT